MKTKVWLIRELDFTDPDDWAILMSEKNRGSSVSNVEQSKIDTSSGNVELATDKQKALMKRLHISFDDGISKEDASSLISKKMEK